jgi:hypothetical protein
MGTGGTFIKCRTCAGTFDTSAINYDPVVACNEFLAKLDVVLVQGLLIVAAAEGPVTEDTMQRIVHYMDALQERDVEMDMVYSLQALAVVLPLLLSCRPCVCSVRTAGLPGPFPKASRLTVAVFGFKSAAAVFMASSDCAHAFHRGGRHS